MIIAEEALRGSQLPVIQRPMDNTALAAYLACKREFFFGMILHRRRGESDAAALGYGKLWHKILEVHYKTGGMREMVRAAAYQHGVGHTSSDDYRTLDRALLDYDKYIARWDEGYGAKAHRSTVGFPDSPLVEIATNAMGEGLIHPWAGKLDRFIELGGLIYIEDHKTTSRLDKNYWKQFELSYQMKGYTYLAKQLFPDKKIAGVRINLAHVLTTKTEFHRQLFAFPDDIIREWVRTTNGHFQNLGRDIARYQELVDSGIDSMEAMIEAFPAHYGDNGCSRKFGMCQYHEICGVSPRLRGRMLESTYEVRPWNPLEMEEEE